MSVAIRIWKHLPASLRLLPPGRRYGRHLHTMVRLHAARKQYFGTFFLRNRPELELMRSLVAQKCHGSSLGISVLACSKGAEVYSFAWAIRSARPDLKLTIHALDISQDVLEFAERGFYSLENPEVLNGRKDDETTESGDLLWNTCRDQNATIFERMTDGEMQALFDGEGNQVEVKSWLKDGIIWLHGDAGDPELVSVLGPQDIVVANRFLCHMEPGPAGSCLRNIARLVKPGGYLFVSGIDLDVRTEVAREMRWEPVTDLIREIHEGDVSLRRGWPLEYWGLEPLDQDRPDWMVRYASVFQLGEPSSTGSGPRCVTALRHNLTQKRAPNEHE